MRNPVNADYLCPFINDRCVKRGHNTEGPYPVCSVWHRKADPRLICVCPKRFYAADLLPAVLEHCWPGAPPANPRVAYEVKMAAFGNVDLVVADVDRETNRVNAFVSVELQAVDLTGSVQPAYTALVTGTDLARCPSYGVNWANVRKRYLSQLVAKGFYHHHWGARIVAVLQTPVYEQFHDFAAWDEIDVQRGPNIVFLLYDYRKVIGGAPDAYELVLERVVGTSHNSLMMASLYHTPPSRDEFCARIIQCIR